MNELIPIHMLLLVVLMNRYVLGPLLRRAKGAQVDQTTDGFEPTVAIVIPLFNEGRGIHDTILSLLQQDYPSDKLQVVVVDDCSTDDSYEWACKAAEGRPNVKVMRNPHNMGKRRGINRAVRVTEVDIIVSVDSDVLVERRAVRELVRRFVHPKIAAVGGRTFVINRHQNWMTRMIEVKFYFAQQWLKELERSMGTVMCLSGCLTAYRREVLLELEPILENRNIAGIPIKYGEDRFLTRQIVKAGYKTAFTFDAWCETSAPHTLAGYFSQQLRWRRSNLVDLIGALSHGWHLRPLLAIHIFAYLALLIAYPVVIIENIVAGEFWHVMLSHTVLVAVLGIIYRVNTRHLPESMRVPALSFVPIAILMPITYVLLTPLALFTLDSGSWETRGKTAQAAGPQATAAPELLGGRG